MLRSWRKKHDERREIIANAEVTRQTTLLSDAIQRNSKILENLEERLGAFLSSSKSPTTRPYWSLDDGWGLAHLDTGQPFFVNTRDRTVTPWILMGGHWETNVERVLLAYVKPGMDVIDVGAHLGYYSIKLARAMENTGHIWAFEPSPEMVPFCKNNIAINGLHGFCELHQFALGDTTGEVILHHDTGNQAQATILNYGSDTCKYTVKVMMLDGAFSAANVDLIKLDAEGSEPAILRGATKTLAYSPHCAIMMEVNLVRWELVETIDDLEKLVGSHRIPLAVIGMGKLRRLAFSEIRGFLSRCLFTEAYILFCPAEKLDSISHLFD